MDNETQRNLLLALLFSMAILLSFSVLFPPRRPAPPLPTATKEDSTPPSPEQLQPSAPLTELLSAEQESVTGEDVRVETPLVEATFTSRGGRLKSLKLKEFRSNGLPYVELVPPSETSDDKNRRDRQEEMLPFSLRFYDDKVADSLNKVNFAAHQTPRSITFRKEIPGKLSLEKSFSFDDGSYIIRTNVSLTNLSDAPFSLGKTEGAGYDFVWEPALEDPRHVSRYSFMLNRAMLSQNVYKEESESKVGKDEVTANVQWAGMKSQYFLVALLPEEPSGTLTVKSIPLGKEELGIAAVGSAYLLSPGETRTDNYRFYAGPNDTTVLTREGSQLHRAVYFGRLDALCKVMLAILNTTHKASRNYGVDIILLTLIVKAVAYPLTRKQMKSMKRMQELAPEMAKIRERYKENAQEMQKQLQQLYKTHGVNPMAGCLPMFIQIPIFFSLYNTLRLAFELKGQPFMLWIDDLSQPDVLVKLPTWIPFLGGSLHFLPLLMMGLMVLQQKVAPMQPGATTDPTQKFMMMFMPVFFGFICYSMPSGLCLYFVASTTSSLVHSYVTKKRTKISPSEVAAAPVTKAARK